MYTFDLHNTSDLSYLGRLEHATNRNFSDTLNNPGAASFSLKLDDPMSYLLDPWGTFLVINFNGTRVWEGPIVNLNEAAAANTVQVNCMGWFEILNRRITRNDYNFIGKSLGEMAGTLISHTDLFDGLLPWIPGHVYVAGFVIPNHQVVKHTYIGQEIKRFTEWENGMDFYFEANTRSMIFTSYRGTFKPNLVFGYNIGPSNLEDITRSIDGANMRNVVLAQGRSGPAQQATASASVASRGAHIEHLSVTGIPGDEAQGLQAYAQAEVAVRGNPIITYNVVPKGFSNDVYIPQPYVDFNVGDTGKVSVNKGRFQVQNQTVRIFGFNVDINESGNGRLTSVALAP